MNRLFGAFLTAALLLVVALSQNAMAGGPSPPGPNPLVGLSIMTGVSAPAAYHVAVTGSDSNSGSASDPWRTISHAAQAVKAGDTVLVHGGAYNEQVSISASGNSSSRIRFYTLPGDRAVVDGSNIGLGRYSPLVDLSGSYLDFEGFEVRVVTSLGSKGECLRVTGDYVQVIGNEIHDCYDHGVKVSAGTGSRVIGNSIYDTNLVVIIAPGTNWGSAITTGTNSPTFPNSQNVEIMDNIVYRSYGEGIDSWLGQNILIKGNTVSDIARPAIYANEAKDVRIESNQVYCDSRNTGGAGILAATERGTVVISENITVVNNIVVGCTHGVGFAHWPGTTVDGMNDVTIAFNTVIDSTEDGVWIGGVSHPGSSLRNNIIYQNNTKATFSGDVSDLVLGPNCWYGPDPGSAKAPDDILADPLLANPSRVLNPDDAKISVSSPCRDKAVSMPNVTQDFFGTVRDASPDIGAHEYRGGVSVSDSLSGTAGAAGWFVSPVQVTLTATDGGSGVAAIHFRTEGGPWQQYIGPFTVEGEGSHTVDYYATDLAGNDSAPSAATFRIDTVAPMTTAVLAGTIGGDGSYISSVTVTLTASDGTSGVQSEQYRVDGGPWQTYGQAFSVGGNGTHLIEYFATDVAGHTEGGRSQSIRITVAPPHVLPLSTLYTAGTAGAGGWYVSPVIVTLTATSGSGSATYIAYRLDGNAWVPYAQPFTLADGRHVLVYQATDADGYSELSKSAAINVDSTPPTVVANSPSLPIAPDESISWSGSDPGSGIARYEVSIDGAAFVSVGLQTSLTRHWTAGTHVVVVRGYDAAGNAKTSVIQFSVAENPTPATPPGPSPPTPPGIPEIIVGLLMLGVSMWFRPRVHSRRPVPSP